MATAPKSETAPVEQPMGDLLPPTATSPFGQLIPYPGLTAAKAAALVSKQIG